VILISYSCSLKQFLIGRKLLAAPGLSAARQRRRTLRLRSFLGWILFSVFAAVFMRLLPKSSHPQQPAPSIWMLWGLYVAAAGMLLTFVGMRLFRWSAWTYFHRRFQQTKLAIGEEGVEQRQPGVRTLFRWDHFTGLAERKGVYALRQPNGEGIILPQSLLSPADLPAIDRLLKEKLAARVPLLAAGFEVKTA